MGGRSFFDEKYFMEENASQEAGGVGGGRNQSGVARNQIYSIKNHAFSGFLNLAFSAGRPRFSRYFIIS